MKKIWKVKFRIEIFDEDGLIFTEDMKYYFHQDTTPEDLDVVVKYLNNVSTDSEIISISEQGKGIYFIKGNKNDIRFVITEISSI